MYVGEAFDRDEERRFIFSPHESRRGSKKSENEKPERFRHPIAEGLSIRKWH
jgi:hypothetical protein